MRDALLLILVDGLRHVDHHTEQRLMPELGFRDVEASLFTGVAVADHHCLTDYIFSDQSPFEPLCTVPALDRVWRRLAPGARRYLSFVLYRGAAALHGCSLPRTSLIPPRHLRHVAPALDRSPDAPGAYGAHESLFDLLCRAGKTWLYAAPPRISPWGASDAKVERLVYESLSHGVRDLYYIKLGDLDRVCHIYGPSSSEAATSRRLTARRVNNLVAAVAAAVGSLRWLLFSDHGFLEVSRRIPPPEGLDDLHRRGRVHYFLDSTMIRVRRTMAGDDPPALGPPPDGAIDLGQEDRKPFGLPWGSPQLGDCAWLASPGTVFWPDFFSASPPAGMHGYRPHPSCAGPLETHGFRHTPLLENHAHLGAWLRETINEG